MKSLVIFYVLVVTMCNFYGGESGQVREDDPIEINILDYKAVANGSSDDTKALTDAWEALCHGNGTAGGARLVIPKNKTFLVRPIKFQGPCKPSRLSIQMEGKIIAPGEPQKMPDNCWLCFMNVNNLNINGLGTFDAKGQAWWSKGIGAGDRPTALGFHGCNNLQIKGTVYINSPRSHIELESCNNATLSNIFISAPKDSPNTDGIVIAKSKHIYVIKSSIAAGDDCIAIKNGSYDINAFEVKCGPGHGISVGSLGVGGSTETVDTVHVRNCTFTNTLNAARVKTWAGGAGYARNIVFEDITLANSWNPIIIDQHYCNGPHNCPDMGKAVEVSNVTFKSFRGTSASPEVIRLDCSKTKICSNIHIEHINIILASPSLGKNVTVYCSNARGTASALISPPDIPCFHTSSHDYFV